MALNLTAGRLLGLLAFFVPSISSGAVDPADPIVVESMTVVLIRHAEIPARDAGMLKTIVVKAGQHVDQGALLFSLDDELQLLAVQKSELTLRVAELKARNNLPVETANAQVREAEQEKARLEIVARISQKQADSDVSVRMAEKTREVAQFELDRAQKARGAFSGSVSNAELNRLQVLFDQKTLEIEKAQEDKVVAEMKTSTDQAAVQQQSETIARSRLLASEREQEQEVAKASLAVAGNELELAKLELERRRLYAPFPASVVSISRQPGEWVEPGAVVLRLIQLDQLRVEGFVRAEESSRMAEGMAVTIQFPGTKLKAVKGAITFVSPEIDPVNQQVRIWAEFENGDRAIRPGLVARMELDPAAQSVDRDTTAPVQSSKE